MAESFNNIRGLAFPIEVVNGAVPLKSGIELIKSSIKIILSWELGVRYFTPEFGSRLHEVLEEPNDVVLEALVNRFTIEPIELWEKRVSLLDIAINRPELDKLTVIIKYLIKPINVEDYLTFEYILK